MRMCMSMAAVTLTCMLVLGGCHLPVSSPACVRSIAEFFPSVETHLLTDNH